MLSECKPSLGLGGELQNEPAALGRWWRWSVGGAGSGNSSKGQGQTLCSEDLTKGPVCRRAEIAFVGGDRGSFMMPKCHLICDHLFLTMSPTPTET